MGVARHPRSPAGAWQRNAWDFVPRKEQPEYLSFPTSIYLTVFSHNPLSLNELLLILPTPPYFTTKLITENLKNLLTGPPVFLRNSFLATEVFLTQRRKFFLQAVHPAFRLSKKF